MFILTMTACRSVLICVGACLTVSVHGVQGDGVLGETDSMVNRQQQQQQAENGFAPPTHLPLQDTHCRYRTNGAVTCTTHTNAVT